LGVHPKKFRLERMSIMSKTSTSLSVLLAVAAFGLSSSATADARAGASASASSGPAHVTTASSCGTVRQRGGGGVLANIRAAGIGCSKARALLASGSLDGWRFSSDGRREHARNGRRHISWVAAGC
jgi:hypothetical protein